MHMLGSSNSHPWLIGNRLIKHDEAGKVLLCDPGSHTRISWSKDSPKQVVGDLAVNVSAGSLSRRSLGTGQSSGVVHCWSKTGQDSSMGVYKLPIGCL